MEALQLQPPRRTLMMETSPYSSTRNCMVLGDERVSSDETGRRQRRRTRGRMTIAYYSDVDPAGKSTYRTIMYTAGPRRTPQAVRPVHSTIPSSHLRYPLLERGEESTMNMTLSPLIVTLLFSLAILGTVQSFTNMGVTEFPSTASRRGMTIVSPFDNGDSESVLATATPTTSYSPLPTDDEPLDLTWENVDLVLEEMRPYLLQDGGNVAISEIDGPIVRLELQVSGVYQCSLHFPDFVQTTKPKIPPTSTAIPTTLNTNDGSTYHES
jgi:hypothetical protein